MTCPSTKPWGVGENVASVDRVARSGGMTSNQICLTSSSDVLTRRTVLPTVEPSSAIAYSRWMSSPTSVCVTESASSSVVSSAPPSSRVRAQPTPAPARPMTISAVASDGTNFRWRRERVLVAPAAGSDSRRRATCTVPILGVARSPVPRANRPSVVAGCATGSLTGTSGTGRPSAVAASCSSCPKADAVAGRSAGSLARPRAMAAASGSGTPCSRRSGGSAVAMRAISGTRLSSSGRSNGAWPVRAWNSTLASE